MRLKLLLLFLPLYLAANTPDFYVWQRNHTSEVRSAVAEFIKFSSGKLFFVAGELENDGRSVQIKIPDYVHGFYDRVTPVIRVHVRNLKHTPEFLAKKILQLYAPWNKCASLQIDLDTPERRIDYYTELMQKLKLLLPGVKISATVLPCHVRHHREFSRLAAVCDYFVLQIHGLEKRNGTLSILDRNIALKSISDAVAFKRPFRIALPVYSHNINGITVKPDLLLASKIARLAAQNKIGVIVFRLGTDGDGEALKLSTAQDICCGKYSPRLRHYWKRSPDGAWHLYIRNYGYFSERIELQLDWNSEFNITDADVLGEAALSFDRRTLKLILPADGREKAVLWVRSTSNIDLENNNNILTVSGKEIVCQ